MEKLKIEIEDVLTKKNAENKVYWILRSKGEGYFVWDKKLLEGIEIGDTVTIIYVPGKFPKVTEIIAEGGSKPQPTDETESEVETVSKQQSIHRSVALQAAVEFQKSDPKRDPKTVVSTAETFYNFLENDEDPKE